MLLGSRNTLSFCLCVLGFGCPRNSRTCPKTGFIHNLLIMSQTRPKRDRWGTLTTTWVSVISSGSRTLIPSSVMWTTDNRPSGSGSVETERLNCCFTENNLSSKLVLTLVYLQDTKSSHWTIKLLLKFSNLLNTVVSVGEWEASEGLCSWPWLEGIDCPREQRVQITDKCKVWQISLKI